MKNYVQDGDFLTLVAPHECASGAGALVGSLFGVATGNIADGAEGEFATTGVYDLAKVPAQAWTVGAKVYWSAADRQCTTVATGNTLIGAAVAEAANPSATGRVRLNGAAA